MSQRYVVFEFEGKQPISVCVRVNFRNLAPLGMPKMSLTLYEPIWNILRSNLHTTTSACTASLPNMEGLVCKATNPGLKVMLR